MTEAALRDIERNVAVGRTLWVDRYALDTMAALVAEVRRLRDEVRFYRDRAVEAQRRAERLEAGR